MLLRMIGEIKVLVTSLDPFLSSFSISQRCSQNQSPSCLPVSVMYNPGTAEPGRAGGASAPPPNNFGKFFFSIEKLLFYCFYRYAIINEDFCQ